VVVSTDAVALARDVRLGAQGSCSYGSADCNSGYIPQRGVGCVCKTGETANCSWWDGLLAARIFLGLLCACSMLPKLLITNCWSL
jgi:hypothetical protein